MSVAHENARRIISDILGKQNIEHVWFVGCGGSLTGCIDSLEVRKKPGGHWIIRDLAGLDLVGLASQ